MEPCIFRPELEKIKISTSKKFLILQVTEAPKKLLIFSQKKAFLIFRKTETPKKFFTFQETELSYISGKGYSEP